MDCPSAEKRGVAALFMPAGRLRITRCTVGLRTVMSTSVEALRGWNSPSKLVCLPSVTDTMNESVCAAS
jgi:hypothetical protein